MNEHNPPIVLPNGTVYSDKAVQQHTNNFYFVDPVSGEACMGFHKSSFVLHVPSQWISTLGAVQERPFLGVSFAEPTYPESGRLCWMVAL